MSETKKNWKAEFPLSKKIPDMPKNSDWKKSFDKFAVVDKREKPEKIKKEKKQLKQTPLKPSKKPIKKVGARTKARIAEYGTESDFYFMVWEKRGGLKKPIICACGCNQQVIDPFIQDAETGKWKLVKPQCFAHILAKGLYKRFRYLEKNIDIVATMKCHTDNDKKYNDLAVRADLEKKFDSIIAKL